MIKQVIEFMNFCINRFKTSNILLLFSTAITALIAICTATIMPVLQRRIIADVQMGSMNNILLLIMLALSFVSIICSVYESLVLNRLSMDLQNCLHRELFSKAIRYSSKTIMTRGSGAFIASMFGDSERIAGLLNTNYFSLFLVFISSIIIIAITLTWSSIFITVVGPIYIISILVIFFSNKVYIKRYSQGREDIMRLNPKVLERIENRISILGFSNISTIETALFSEFDIRDNHFRKAYAASTFSRTAVEALKTIGLAVLFLLSMTQIYSGKLNIATFIAMLAYYTSIFIPISAVLNITQGMSSFKLHFERIKNDLDKIPDIVLPKTKKLCFVNCSFKYDNSENGQIENFSLNIENRIGLVGLSGEGKTTAIKILFGEILPQKGNCLLGGVEISSISKAVLYSLMRLYNQDIELFDDTLKYNITLGKQPLNKKEYSDTVTAYLTRILDCAENLKKQNYRGGALEIVKDLFLLTDKNIKDHNLLKCIGKELTSVNSMFETFAEVLVSRKYYSVERYEAIVNDLDIAYLDDRDFGQRGSKVSGGEKNKISLARFLLPINKGFYIIDEPLTSIDAIAEEKCIKAISEYLECPGIIISHKLNIIKALSDEILILENGIITEKGTHNSLLEDNGLYTRLYEKFTNLKSI